MEAAFFSLVEQAVYGNDFIPDGFGNLFRSKLAVAGSAKIKNHGIPPLSVKNHSISIVSYIISLSTSIFVQTAQLNHQRVLAAHL